MALVISQVFASRWRPLMLSSKGNGFAQVAEGDEAAEEEVG